MISKALTCLAIFAVLLAAWLTHSHHQTQAVALTEPGTENIACVSYAPYREPGQTPFDPDHFVDESRIRDDLIKLSAVTDCVRTYSSQRGLQAVPRIAHELGMKVLLGIWIGRNDVDNRLEIEEGIRQAQAWPASIRGVIVGNEVLLRREQTAQGMANYLDTVRAAVTIPVTYADVWEFWVKNESLASHVDYMTVHILPYWEDHPVGIDAAVTHVADIFEQVQARFAGKPMMIGETGWPSAGRQRGPARPGNLAQAEFIRAWTATAKQKNIDYNLIEGFDQPWKRLLEGAMGGHWGMLDSAGERKFPWRGAMAENPTALRNALIGAVLGLIAFVTTSLGLKRLIRPAAPVAGWILPTLAAIVGACAGALLPAQWNYLHDWNRYASEWVASSAFGLVSLALAALLPALIAYRITIPSAAAAWSHRATDQHAQSGPERLARVAAYLRLALLFMVAAFIMLHAFDARYRGFAIALYVLPFGIVLALAATGLRLPATALQERWLGLVIVLGLPFMLWPELPSNPDAMMLAAMAAAIGLYALLPRRSSNNVASNAATAPGSTE